MRLLLVCFSLLFINTVTAQTYQVNMKTTLGEVDFFLYDKTPKHRDNMVKLIKDGFYDSLLFHRVIPQFMVQAGDPESKQAAANKILGEGDVGYRVDAEITPEYFHRRGVVAAARDGNPAKASSGCQFYITVGKVFNDEELDAISKKTGRIFTDAQRIVYKTLGGTPHLDGNYTVFGEVTKGIEVIDKIVNQPRNQMDRPNEDIRILSMSVKKKKRGLFSK